MKFLLIGDVVGQGGCDILRNRLPQLKKKHNIDLVIANGENSAEGNGILPSSATQLFESGVDVITTGNHALRRREIYEIMDSEDSTILRPANFHKDAPGKGVLLLDCLRYQLCVINLQGCVYMENNYNPFDCIDEILQQVTTPNIILDFHGEATSEKLAMGHYLRGRVSAVLGTHTHVATADERIFPEGTAYITDVGMCGGEDSILGVRPDLVIKRFRTNLPVRFENVKEDCVLQGVVVELDTNTGKCSKIERIYVK